MNLTISPAQSDILRMTRNFLLAILPDGNEVILAQANRVPEPKVDDYTLMTPLRRDRLSTNVDDYVDCLFTGSVSGKILTVSALSFGTIGANRPLFGVGVTADTTILSQISGTSGGIGTYSLDTAQTVASEALACGTADLLQPTQITIQLDVHGPNSADNVQAITTAFRDTYGVEFFAAQTPPLPIIPLYTSEPRQAPFINENAQYEWRWTVDLYLQADQTLIVPQQFAGALAMNEVVPVDVLYAP